MYCQKPIKDKLWCVIKLTLWSNKLALKEKKSEKLNSARNKNIELIIKHFKLIWNLPTNRKSKLLKK